MSDEKMPAVDPVRATGVFAIGSQNGVALIFNRAVFRPDEKSANPEMVTSAAVDMPWALVAEVHNLLGAHLKKLAEQQGTLPKPATEPEPRAPLN